jgi:putative oxidoreductase
MAQQMLTRQQFTCSGESRMDMTHIASHTSVNIGLLVIRVVFGLMIAAHGSQKLFGWFGGYGISGTGQWFTSIGYNPGAAFAAAAGTGEFTSGLLIALGFLGPVGPALMISVMLVAMITVHRGNGLFATTNGIELPLLNIAAADGLALTGYGRYSLDAKFGLASMWTPTLVWIVILIGIVGGLANVAIRKTPPPAPKP